ncbi:Ger(x)C family germination protein [Neobacillus bataviensis LMG 21833]|uniref:Ger(X)C family germination protein n=1 Tax=Neobacillus bataviensis LMG 21833 TaxID=1117379 RepID=K6DRB0_9BACI|nr:Ger(x)C family spore germination protein [Neobacillus bataviensis]EKN70753.1 Ger(x)C family germination protein [Neobacillus bataviensis LMG 21833]
MKLLSKWSFLVLVLLTLTLLNGCGFKDIDKRFFVVSIGVDVTKNSPKKYLVSLKFAIPSESKGTSTDSIIVSEKANSMSEAVRIIKTKVDKEIDFSHAKAIVFGEEVVKQKGNAGINYWFTRRRDIQEIAWVAIGKPSALDVLKVKPKSERIPSNALFLALGKDGSETPYAISEFLFDYKYRLIERGKDPMLPIIKAKKELLEINTVGLFNKSQMKLTLEPEETKMLNFLRKREEKSANKITKGKTTVIIDTHKVKTKYKIITPKGSTPYIKVNVSMEGTLEEATRRVPNTKLSVYEKAAEKSLNKEIEELLVKIQKANLDPIGFGLRYRSRHFNKDDWEQWQRIYPQIKFKVQTKVQIEDTGLIE